MDYVVLGQTGLRVSRLCFGTMSFARDADEEMSGKMFAACREAGINFFDCANMYSRGQAEEILGRLIKDCRDELVITSKVGMAMSEKERGRDLTRRNIMRAAEASLRRLDTDRIDVYFCHHSDPNTRVGETLRALDDLIRQGKILYAGVSNWAAWQIALALGEAGQPGRAPIHVLQPMYNLAKRTAEIEILPLAADRGLAVTPYSPLGGGLLTGKYSTTTKDAEGRLSTNKGYSRRYGDPIHYEIAERFSQYAADAGMHPATLAVAWVASHPAVTAPIIGARNLEQLRPSLAAADVDMSPEQREEITTLTPRVPIATDRTEEQLPPEQ